MSRIARKQTISPKVYRHFAVVTVAITAMLGFFANGENRDAAAEALAAKVTEKPKQTKAPPKQMAALKLGGRRTESWGSDAGPGDGGDSGGSVDAEYSPGKTRPEHVQPPVPMSPAAQLSGLTNLPDTPPPGMPMNVYLQLKAEQKRLKKAGPLVTTKADVESMTAQSRMRSGGEDLPDDQAD